MPLWVLRHLNGFQFEKIKNPTILITDSNSITRQPVNREKETSALLRNNQLNGDQIVLTVLVLVATLETLRKDGSVLIPTDTAGRVLELALLLEDYWTKNK